MNRDKALKQIAEAAKVIFGEGPTPDEEIEKLKQKVNYQTVLGSMSESGGHIHGSMTPLCDFDAISVLNVLRNFEGFDSPVDTLTTKKVSGHEEAWSDL